MVVTCHLFSMPIRPTSISNNSFTKTCKRPQHQSSQVENCLHHTLQKMLPLVLAEVAGKSPHSALENIWAPGCSCDPGEDSDTGTNFSPYIERPSIQESPPSSLTGRSQGQTGEGKFQFPVTQSPTHSGIFSSNAIQVKAAMLTGKL